MIQRPTKAALLFISTILVSSISFAALPPAIQAKVGVSLTKQMNQAAPFPVLVIFKQQADLSAADAISTKEKKGQYVYEQLTKLAKGSQADLVEYLTKKSAKFQQYYIINMISIENANAELVADIARRPDVAKIINNPAVKRPAPIMISARQEQTPSVVEPNIEYVGATKVWNTFGVKGAGIVIAGQDTGVQWDHPALISKYRGVMGDTVDHTYNWHDSIKTPIGESTTNPCGYNIKAPCDDDQHGTHTMGTMVGDDGGANKIGMAPDAKWIACRNMDKGVGRPTTYIECFEFFLAPYPQGADPMTAGKPALAPHVINNSWGCPPDEGCEGGEILPVLTALKKAGIAVVASAGNAGPSCSTIADPPAHYTDVTFSVGAMNHRNGTIAYFSSRGPSKFDKGVGPDVSAPGVGIRSCVPGNAYAGGWSGTSMAGPHVAAHVALMWSANKALIGKLDTTFDIIRKTSTAAQATDSCGGVPGSVIPNNTFGFGIIDSYKAVAAAKEYKP